MAEETAKAIEELVFNEPRVQQSGYNPVIVDAVNLLAKLALYRRDLGEAEIHLSFVSSVCLDKHRETTQFADCLELMEQMALAQGEGETVAGALKWCADIRTKVLGSDHPDSRRSIEQWQRCQEITEIPEPEPQSAVVQ